MGIKNLNQFLREKCPEAFKDIPYSFFKGKRVAVDSDNVLRKLMARAHKEIVNQTDVCTKEPDRQQILERWLYHIREEINKFLKHGITLIFVFDGSYIDEKSETQLKRREAKQKMVDSALEMKQKVLEVDELERTPQMITDLRKKMHHLGNVLPEEKELVCKILKSLGFPILFATEEGEKLCAMLCIEGMVDAVYSKDSDVTAMGCPLSFNDEAGWVYNEESGRTEMSVKSVLFKNILSSLEMEYSTFLDLCIMSGCDFNSNIRLLGVKKAYKLLLDCKSIDNLPEKYNDKKEILNHVRCREIFSRQKAKDICKSELVLNINKNIDEEVLRENELESWVTEVKEYYKDFPKPSNIFIQKIPSQSSSRIKLKVVSKNMNNEVSKDMNNEVSKDMNNEVSKDMNNEVKNEEKKIPEQVASPKKLKQKTIQDLNNRQLERLREKMEKKELKLKIVS